MLARNFKSAVDLGISEKERDALIGVLGMLERGELIHAEPVDMFDLRNNKPWRHSEQKPAGLFNMMTYGHTTECGTVACIAGTADQMYGTHFQGDLLYRSAFAAVPRRRSLHDLFMCGGMTIVAMSKVTTDQAATALRNYLTTGIARWTEVLTSARLPV